MKKIISLTILVSIIASCNCKKPLARFQAVKNVETSSEMIDKVKSDINFTIDSVWADKNILHIDIAYVGEKGQPEFALVFNGMWQKIYPPRATVSLVNLDDKLGGKKSVKHHLSFDLSSMSAPNTTFDVEVKGFSKRIRIENKD
ncbi:MAG: hypothetical protein GX259_10215 [Bacteroidales bacterium]|nr:hypothetical protein [Bacteroidales bacterium]